jgi:hypothetical protein
MPSSLSTFRSATDEISAAAIVTNMAASIFCGNAAKTCELLSLIGLSLLEALTVKSNLTR